MRINESSLPNEGIKPQKTRGLSTGTDFLELYKTQLEKQGEGQTYSASGYEEIFEKASEAYGVPVKLLQAVAKAESGFDAAAVSHCGAAGVMQLMPGTAKSLGVQNSFDPEQNIMGGAKYLHQMLERYGGDVTLALAAYNAGPGNVKKYGGVPPFAETKNYINKVLGYAGGEITLPKTTGNALGSTDPSFTEDQETDPQHYATGFLLELLASRNEASTRIGQLDSEKE